jgi:hypothetical protein
MASGRRDELPAGKHDTERSLRDGEINECTVPLLSVIARRAQRN